MTLGIHALLDDSPLSGFRDYKGMEVELKTIGHGIVINARSQSAGARKAFARHKQQSPNR